MPTKDAMYAIRSELHVTATGKKMNAFLKTIAGSAVAGLLTLAPAAAQELTDIKLRLAFIPGGVDAPFFVAAKKGYFTEQGLNVTITDGDGSTGTIKALMAGDFDIGIASLGTTAKAIQTGGAKDLIATAALVQKDPSSIISLAGSGIATPKDIEGKKFGTDAGNLEDGMIKAFAKIQNMRGQVNPSDLAEGIGNALLTTAAGLAVAIPVVIFYNYFLSRVEGMIVEMEASSSELIDLLTRNRGEREI